MSDKKKNISIIVKYAKELNETDIVNFKKVHEMEYGNQINDREFQKKYFKNIYGQSVFVFSYDEKQCIGTQVFLRNDINGKPAFQSGDSIVLSAYRGMGLFSRMVKMGVERIGNDVLIYGFPNNNSLPAFQKMGWNIGERKKYRIFRKCHKDEIENIDDAYYSWLIQDNDNIYSVKCGRHYYLAKKRKKNIYTVYGKITKRQAELIKRVKMPILLYYSKRGKWGNGMLQITKNVSNINIADFKMDTLL